MTEGFDEETPPTLTMLNDGKNVRRCRWCDDCEARATWHSPSWDLDILEPGWTVGFDEDQSQLWVRYEGVQVH